jgi:CRISPR/Cas system-associated protein Cas10 (large subunit of type III CRISPR-Cas system)
MADEYIVAFDTDQIKDYVFTTDKLREVRGASYLLDKLNRELSWRKIRKLSSERIFFAGGSGAVLTPSPEHADAVICEVEKLYRRVTCTASITGVSVPLAPATRTNGFGNRMQLAALQLREKKDRKASRILATIEPYTQTCSACERYPATLVSPVDQSPICNSCHAKRSAARKQKKRQMEESAEAQLAEELKDLGELSRPPGYIGFIYADGNNMGSYLDQLLSVEDYRTYSSKLNELIESSVNSSLQKHSAHKGILPYEKLLVGGDDLMIMTTGDIALPVALDIAETFQRDSPNLLQAINRPHDPPHTMGVAVVLAHANFPIAAFLHLAKQLLEKAKRRCAEEEYKTSAIDFMVVTAAGSSDVKTLREEVLSQESFAYPHIDRLVRMTQRPYTLLEAKSLLSHLQKFKRENFPRSQLQFLYEGLFHSYYEAFYRWCKVAGRARKEHWDLMIDFHREFNGPNGIPPWRSGIIRWGKHAGKQGYTSALGDLIEIYQFVQPA